MISFCKFKAGKLVSFHCYDSQEGKTDSFGEKESSTQQKCKAGQVSYVKERFDML